MRKARPYLRVSTLEQAVEGYSIGEQRERLVAFCKAHDWLVADIYVDGGYTGANLDRPGIQKLIAEIQKDDIVLVYKLDRLSRSQRDTLHLIEEVFLPNGVEFVSMQESFDTSTPFGRAMIGMLSVFAQLEREQIKERTRMGKIARAKEGLYHGGFYHPVGYDYANGKLVVNEYEAMQVRKIYDWYIAGMSPVKIADRLRKEGYTNRYGSWSEISNGMGVSRVICNDIYTGTLRYDTVVVENAHEAIVSRDHYEKANEMRKKRHEIYGDTAYVSKYLLAGFLFCARCGARYHVKHNYGGYKYYVCYSRAQTVKRMAKADHCDNDNWRLDDLEARVLEAVTRLLVDPKHLDSLLKKHEKDRASKGKARDEADIIRSKIDEAEKSIGRLMDLYQAENLPADILSARIDKLYREKLAFAEQLNKLEPQAQKKDYDAAGISELIAELSTVWESADQSEQRLIMETLIDRIVLDGNTIRIEWAFLNR
ncbi:MAG: recombinase family protein [Clostridiales Family XIII bacterium]|jgi:site-specific DNA recombinase|nr:recombinase family protein [Clostridiales Family XIII bacterium]